MPAEAAISMRIAKHFPITSSQDHKMIMLDNAKSLSFNKFLSYALRMIQGGKMKSDIQSLKRWLGMTLFVLSFAFYGCLLLVPFTSFSAEGKIALSTYLVILGEGSFWLSVIILGREAIAKYRKVDWQNRLSGWLKKT